MGQKSNPIGLRIGINQMWESSWFTRSRQEFCAFLYQDFELRKLFKKFLKKAGISRILIERPNKKCNISVYAARPGYVIGRKGEDVDKIKKSASKIVGNPVQVNIIEVKSPQMDPVLIAEEIAQSLERRMPHKRLMKKYVQGARRAGAKGSRVKISGRLGGVEIARSEEYSEGPMPLHKLRADVGFGFAEAMTSYGVCGVKVWVYKGDTTDTDLTSDKRHQGDGSGGEGSKQDRDGASVMHPDNGPDLERIEEENKDAAA